ncbi:putative ParG-like protein [Bacillus phage Kirov]|uniref:Putative ParG-like protein n=1 Tax=Bacillus phage Kirov TaxID=2783539 RepID=A0A7S6RBT1_9CAUD|nr:putative ParG-like protein [Bacillus phage Kirov]QOV08212.1 putative ParG-like protein [Bacillus phage Kirov]
MTWFKSEAEVDEAIAKMVSRTKGKYITQGVSFNKTCPRQMDLLKKALMSSASFSGLAKESLALRFSSPAPADNRVYVQKQPSMSRNVENLSEKKIKPKNTGNFL